MVYNEKERWLIIQLIENISISEKAGEKYVVDMMCFSKPNKYTNNDIFEYTFKVYNFANKLIDKYVQEKKELDLKIFKKELKEMIIDGKSI